MHSIQLIHRWPPYCEERAAMAERANMVRISDVADEEMQAWDEILRRASRKTI